MGWRDRLQTIRAEQLAQTTCGEKPPTEGEGVLTEHLAQLAQTTLEQIPSTGGGSCPDSRRSSRAASCRFAATPGLG